MIYVEGEGFKPTEGDSWDRVMIVLQFPNKQGAWMDEVLMEKNSVFKDTDILDFSTRNVPVNQPYRILRRESKETIIKIEE